MRGKDAGADLDDRSEGEELARLRAEMRGLRYGSTSRVFVGQAQGVLRERYGLPDTESAFALLQRASQQHNVRLRTLADAVVDAPRPEPGAPLWLPRRVRQPEPPLRPGADGTGGRPDRGEALGTVLHRTLDLVGAGMGNVQIADRRTGGLRLEKHTGLTRDFVEYFAYIEDEGTSCELAARSVAQVTVHDVATDPSFGEPARETVLRAGSRACHSVPLATGSGVLLGMVSAHVERPLRDLTRTQLGELAAVGAAGGRWLAWYDRTVLLDALEYLHALGRTTAGRGVRRR